MSGNRPTIPTAPAFPIEGDGVVIDRLVPGDAEAFAAYRSDPGVARYQSWSVPYPVAAALDLIESAAVEEPFTPSSWVQLAVRADVGGPLLGDVYVACPDDEPGSAELGVTIAPAAQGHGLATRALRAVLAEVLAKGSGIGIVHAYVHAENAASLALFDRLGLRRDGTTPDPSADGSYGEDVVFTTTRSEWGGLA